MDSLTCGSAEPDLKQELIALADARDLYFKNLHQWVENDSDEAFAARPGIKSLAAPPGKSLYKRGRTTAIHEVIKAEEGSDNLLAKLLKRNAVANIPDDEGFYAVHTAVTIGSVEQLELLKGAGAPMSVQVGQDTFLESFGQHGWLGATGLHLAVEEGNFRALELFLASGVDPCVQRWDGSTAMHIAANHLDPEGPDDYEGMCIRLLSPLAQCLVLVG